MGVMPGIHPAEVADVLDGTYGLEGLAVDDEVLFPAVGRDQEVIFAVAGVELRGLLVWVSFVVEDLMGGGLGHFLTPARSMMDCIQVS